METRGAGQQGTGTQGREGGISWMMRVAKRTGQDNLTRAENPGMDKARRKVLRPSSSPC